MPNASAIIDTRDQELLIQEKLDKRAAQKRLIGMIIPYLGLAFIFVFFTIVTNGRFLSPVNIENLINQSFTLTIIAIGSVFVYAHGGKDMSIGASSGVGQLACAMLLVAGFPVWIAVSACILVTMAAASAVAGIAIKLRVPVFIGSMCIRTSFVGILQMVTLQGEVIVDFQRYNYMNSSTAKFIIILVFCAIGYFMFSFTSFGKYNKAIGGNQVTAAQAGIQTNKSILFAFLFMGFCVGVSAMFSLFRLGKVTGTSGSGIEFNIMIAMALGGVPMMGGEKTKISSAIVGAISIIFLTNGLQLWGLLPAVINGAKGLLFVIIIALSYDRSAGKLIS